jgi:hypothetical protein
MQHRFPARRNVRSGQSLHLQARSGDTIVALCGAVEIDGATAWLGERMVQTRHRLDEGEAHAVIQDGWVTIVARGDAEVACIARESRDRLISALLDRVLASLAAALRRMRLAHAKTGKDL